MTDNGKAVLYGISSWISTGCGNPEGPNVFGDVYSMKSFIDDFLVRIFFTNTPWAGIMYCQVRVGETNGD